MPAEFVPEIDETELQDMDEKSWNRPELAPLDPSTTSLSTYPWTSYFESERGTELCAWQFSSRITVSSIWADQWQVLDL